MIGCQINTQHVKIFNFNPIVHEQQKKEQEERRKNLDKLHKVPFNPAKMKRKLIFEYPFLGKDEQYTYSFLLQEDPYDATKDEILRHKWMEEAK